MTSEPSLTAVSTASCLTVNKKNMPGVFCLGLRRNGWGHCLTLHCTIAEAESSARAVSKNPSG